MECYTNTTRGVAILTLRKCYLDLTITSVALTLLEGCFDTLATVQGFFQHSVGVIVTPSRG